MDRKELRELARRIGINSTDSWSAGPHNFVHAVTCSMPYTSRRLRASRCINRLQEILEESPHMSLSLADLAQLLNLERTYCCKVFQELTGVYFSEWMRKIRIAKAQRLLQLSGYTITEVSHAVGYYDITTFSRNFRKELGLSPSSFRRQSLGPLDAIEVRGE